VVAVDEGALARIADVVIAPTAQAIAEAALRPDRRPVTTESNEAVARRLMGLVGQR
jgi:hypothetical protein